MNIRVTVITVLLAFFAFIASGCFQVNAPKDVNVNVGGKKETVQYSTDKEYWKNYGKSYSSSGSSDSKKDDSKKKDSDDDEDDD